MRTRTPREGGTGDRDRDREISTTRAELDHQPVIWRAPVQALWAWLPTH